MKTIILATLLCSFLISPVFATDKDYSQAAGHTGVYVNSPNVWALKCRIITNDSTIQNSS